jgi:hypothetical protein
MLRNRPRLAITCGRCGKPREGIRHVCVSNSRRSATLKPSIDFGKCGTCKKSIGNPLTHACAPKSDFKARKSRAAKREKAREREKARKKRQAEQHDFQSCRDDECKRPTCVAYRTGWHEGEAAGFGAGFSAGHSEGFAQGLASCPGPHGTA